MLIWETLVSSHGFTLKSVETADPQASESSVIIKSWSGSPVPT